MARLFRERGTMGDSKREASGNSLRFSSTTAMAAADLPSPYGQLGCAILDRELRETAYEIFVAVCRSTGSRPLTYIPQSERTPPSVDRSPSSQASSSPLSSSSSSLQRSLTSTAASKMKKALGIKSSKKSPGKESSPSKGSKRPATVGELMRVQMGISEQADSRIRRGLVRVGASQVNSEIFRVFGSVPFVSFRLLCNIMLDI